MNREQWMWMRASVALVAAAAAALKRAARAARVTPAEDTPASPEPVVTRS